jgi:hypothetical protein
VNFAEGSEKLSRHGGKSRIQREELHKLAAIQDLPPNGSFEVIIRARE